MDRYPRLPTYYRKEFKDIDFRKQPELYQVWKGEQGVLLVEPYKAEVLPYRRFKTPDIAKSSSEKLYELFEEYVNQEDFVGADMTRKFLQMWYTRARRYANHKSGQKYAKNPQHEATMEEEKTARKKYLLPDDPDPIKAQSARIFYEKWQLAEENERYKEKKQRWKQKYG